MSLRFTLPIAALIYGLSLSVTSFAAEKSSKKKNYPFISGETLLRVNGAQISDISSGAKTGLVTTKIEPFVRFHFNPYVSVNVTYDYDSRKQGVNQEFASYNGDMYVNKDYRLRMSELNVRLFSPDKDFEVFLGKISPEFGMAWDRGYGIWGTSFANGYRLREKIGGMLRINALTEYLASKYVSVTLASFFSDTTDLSRSAFQSGVTRNSVNSKGAGNDGKPTSYSIAVNGYLPHIGLSTKSNLSYHVAYRNLSKPKATGPSYVREKGYVLGGEYQYHITPRLNFKLLAELTQINNLNGYKSDKAKYATTGAMLEYFGWSINYTQLMANIKENTLLAVEGPNIYDLNRGYFGQYIQSRLGLISSGTQKYSLSQISGGYSFNNGLAIEIGRKILKYDNHGTRNGFGGMVSYILKFD